MDEGWIKLYRKFINGPIFQSRDYYLIQLSLYCLLTANWKDKDVVLGNEVIKLKRGQFISGRKQLVRDLTNCKKENSKNFKKYESLYRRKLLTLEKLSFLTIKSTNKYSIVTIYNYERYQQNDQQMTNNRPTDDQQMTTTKNIKKIKKINNKETLWKEFEELKRKKDKTDWETRRYMALNEKLSFVDKSN
ncbi:hypothetical protein HY345_01730 [Candidatus Microgenomates bacterium]|nr:hypothetical protein [Candidatus Microgenomates bacterium]